MDLEKMYLAILDKYYEHWPKSAPPSLPTVHIIMSAESGDALPAPAKPTEDPGDDPGEDPGSGDDPADEQPSGSVRVTRSGGAPLREAPDANVQPVQPRLYKGEKTHILDWAHDDSREFYLLWVRPFKDFHGERRFEQDQLWVEVADVELVEE
jgi:hypothetical protein